MNTRPIPPGTAPCVACGYQVARRDNAGNISISITVNPGVKADILNTSAGADAP